MVFHKTSLSQFRVLYWKTKFLLSLAKRTDRKYCGILYKLIHNVEIVVSLNFQNFYFHGITTERNNLFTETS